MKNLVLSYATNIKPDEFSRLVRSIRRFMPPSGTDVAVITNATAPQITDLADALSVRLIPALSIWSQVQSSRFMRIFFRVIFEVLERSEKRLAPDAKRREIHEVLAAIWSHPIAARHFAYIQYLEQNPNHRLVMLSDARDVVFQADPFDGMKGGVVHAFLQDESLAYGGRNIDTDWYRGIYGSAALAEVEGKPIACAGTIFGDVPSLLGLERAMFSEIVRLKRGVVDQAVFNMLINRPHQKFETVFHRNLHSHVLTFGDVPAESFRIAGDRVVVDDHLPAVLHQYDRVPSVLQMLRTALA
jgi:hypothetical protein